MQITLVLMMNKAKQKQKKLFAKQQRMENWFGGGLMA